MAATSTLGYALLGLLAREPSSGYDLARRMRDWVGFFWPAPHSRIYPELARLEAGGLVTHERIEQTERPSKKVYSLTEAGSTVVRAWVAAPPPPPERRDAFVLRVFSLWLLEPAEAAVLLRAQERAQREQLEAYAAIEADLERRLGPRLQNPRDPAFASHATLLRGISFAREYAAWCAEIAGRLERGGADATADTPIAH